MDSEEIIKRLTGFVLPSYYEALHILLANRDWFPRFYDEAGNEQLVIIELNKNPDQESIEAIQLAKKRWEESFVEPFHDAVTKIGKEEFDEQSSEIISNFAKNPTQFSSNMINRPLTEGIASDLLDQCILKHKIQHVLFNNEKILRQLSSNQMKLIEPLVQVSVCGVCHNFELLLSSYPKKESKCSMCTRDVLIARIYTLNRNFEIHKLKNKDLPLFVANYISKKRPQSEVRVSYKIEDKSHLGLNGDIDVYIPSIQTGIECKLFVDSSPQGNQLEAKRGEITDVLLKYVKFGLKRIIALTNLSETEAKSVEEYAKRKLSEQGVVPKYLRIGFFSVADLISILDQEISLI